MLADGAAEASAGGETLWLLPQRAAYWPRTRTLIVADAHLGKAAAFRKAGVPVPSGTTAENLERLTNLIRSLDAARVAFIGDLVHDAAAQKAAGAAFSAWRETHRELEMVLVRGNHDRRAGDPPCEWRLDCVDDPCIIDGLALAHIPRRVGGHYALAGHVHPAAQLAGRGRDFARLPCFYFTPEYAILPAFGVFTGMAEVTPGSDDRVYVVAGDTVLRV